MWNEGYSPNQMRQAWITPGWKGDSKLLAINYRPVALTNHLSKIFESIVREKILNHLTCVGLCDEDQHDHRKEKAQSLNF